MELEENGSLICLEKGKTRYLFELQYLFFKDERGSNVVTLEEGGPLVQFLSQSSSFNVSLELNNVCLER